MEKDIKQNDKSFIDYFSNHNIVPGGFIYSQHNLFFKRKEFPYAIRGDGRSKWSQYEYLY